MGRKSGGVSRLLDAEDRSAGADQPTYQQGHIACSAADIQDLHASRDAGAPEEVLRLWFDQRGLLSEALHLSCRPAEHVAVGCHCRVLQVQDPWSTMCPSLGKGNRARPRNSQTASMELSSLSVLVEVK